MGLDLTTRPDPLSELRSSLSLPAKTVPSVSQLSYPKSHNFKGAIKTC
jgi:hypothetical protein